MKKIFYTVLTFGLLLFTASSTFARPAKKDVCHANGSGEYHLINISERAVGAHMDHGDALPGDAVPDMEGYEFGDSCEMEQIPFDGETKIVEGWPIQVDTESFGDLFWQAEGRFGNNADNGDWEIGVGNDTQDSLESENAQYIWGTSPVMKEFIVEYDADTKTATFTVNDDSVEYMVGSDTATNLYLIARASTGEEAYVELSELMLNGVFIGEDVRAEDGNVESLKITGIDLTEDFTVTGTVEMEYTSTIGSAPAFQVQVSG